MSQDLQDLRFDQWFDQCEKELLDLSKRNPLIQCRPSQRLTVRHPAAADLYRGLLHRSSKSPTSKRKYTVHLPAASAHASPVELARAPAPSVEGRTNGEVSALAPAQHARLEIAVAAPGRDLVVFEGDRLAIERRLSRLQQRARIAKQEFGIDALFMGFGLLEWRESSESGEVLTSPLLLVPVALERQRGSTLYEISALEDGAELNPALARLLEREYDTQLTLPDGADERDLSLPELLRYCEDALARLTVPHIVKPDAFLGFFSFHKFAMYEDLRKNRHRFKHHPVIRIIAGVDNVRVNLGADLPHVRQLDDVLAPRDVFQVLDADSSQQHALLAIRRGHHLVIQGPPGTGKSQTIANAIAEALADGKKVLFVSEKLAALEVVSKRLREVGLGEFLLELHSDRADRKAVVQALFRALNARDVGSADDVPSQLEQLYIKRNQLNAYVRALHDSNTPLERSAYWVHGQLASLADAPNIHFECPDVATLTLPYLEYLCEIVRRLANVGGVLRAGTQHPWYGCRLRQIDPYVRSRLEEWLQRLQRQADQLACAQETFRRDWQLPPGVSLADADWLAGLSELLEPTEPVSFSQHVAPATQVVAPPGRSDIRDLVPAHWLTVPDLRPYQDVAVEWEQKVAVYYQRYRALQEVYDARLWSRDLRWLEEGLTALDAFPVRLLPDGPSLAEAALTHRSLLEETLPPFMQSLQELAERTRALANALGLTASPTVAEARRLLTIGRLAARAPRPLDRWLDPVALADIEALAEAASARQKLVTALRPALEDRYDARFFELAASELGATFAQRYASWFRWLRPSYHRDLGRIQETARQPGALGYAQVADALHQARRVLEAEQWLAEHRRELAASLGPHYRGPATDWDAVLQALQTTRELLAQFEDAHLPPGLLAVLRHPDTAAAVGPLVESLASVVEAVDRLHGTLRPKVAFEALLGKARSWDHVACSELCGHLQAWYDALRHFWQAVDDLQGLRRAQASLAVLRADLENAITVDRIWAELNGAEPRLRQDFGALYDGLTTDWPRVQRALQWVDRLRQHFRGAVPAGFVQAFVTWQGQPPASIQAFKVAYKGLSAVLSELDDWFEEPRARELRATWRDRPLTELARWAAAQQEQLPQLEEWAFLHRELDNARAEGLTSFVEALRTTEYPPESWEPAFRRQIYTRWLTWRYQQAPALRDFHRESHERALEEFRRLDRDQFKLAAQRITRRLRAARPWLESAVHPASEPALLQREAMKQRPMRLRRLFASIPGLLVNLKPCLLMSPLSVAQYLGEIDPPIEFDLVLFDEASQIVPADAVGAIGRAKQVVVVGDNKQLPPTRFFQRAIDEEAPEDADDEPPPESVLEACARCLPSVMLRWHYRSRHEELIAFSNRWFYDGHLLTFPSPSAGERAVEFIYVPNAIYDRGGSRRNRQEAARVVQLVADHVQRYPQQSLGVVALSEPQMEEIQMQLEQYQRQHPELQPLLREDGPEGFFVKNLENVQGDERDVIILSIGYGPDASGRFAYNFGPLTQEGGERRLNVAITRARQRVKVVASFRPEQIDLTRVTKDGTKLLRQYLEFAERGPAVLAAPLIREDGEPESPFEEAVAAALRQRGLNIVSQVGIGPYRIDLAIKDEATGRYVLGIECDGATYHRSPTARDRDRLRQEVLERLGWRIHRIWSTNWLKDPAGEVERVLAALASARRASPADSSAKPIVSPDAIDCEQRLGPFEERDSSAKPIVSPDATSSHTTLDTVPRRDSGTTVSWTARDFGSAGADAMPSGSQSGRASAQPYVRAQLPRQRGPGRLDTASLDSLAALIQQCVQIEGPVHEDRVFAAVAWSYGAYLTHAARARLRRAVDRAVQRGLIEQRGRFLWPSGMQVPPVREATADGELRLIEHVPPEEIGEACRAVLHANLSLPYPALVQAVAWLLGYQRAGKKIQEAIQVVIRDLLQRGVLREMGGNLTLAERGVR